MSISSSNRPFAPTSYPTSPSPTASSVNYSQYGGSAFSPTGRPGQGPASLGASSSKMVGAGIRSTSNSGPGTGPGSGAAGAAGAKVRGENREIAKVHYAALREFLASWLEKESPSARASAREKLTRLTKTQFQELSTDVYDELMRRTGADGGNPDEVPFLPVRDDFHPKRNQARQKLATLPRNRFKDLASDVFYELKRRFPEFDAEVRDTQYDEPPPAPGPIPSRHPYATQAQSQSQPSFRDPAQQDRQRTNPTAPPPIARLNSAASSHMRQASRNISGGSSVGSIPQGQGQGQGHHSRPSRDRDFSAGQGQGQGINMTAATSEVVVPNKSRMISEEIEVPYARESRNLDEALPVSRSGSRASNRDQLNNNNTDSNTNNNTLGRSGSRQSFLDQRERPNANPPEGVISPQLTNDDRDYYDRLSFSSNVTSKSKPGLGGLDEDREQKIRAEYEFRIASLERRVAVAEAERDDARRNIGVEKERRREYEDEVRGLKERAATHASSLRSVQHELDLARDATEAARAHADQSVRAAETELSQWRERSEGLEDEIRRLEEKPGSASRGVSSSNPNSDQVTSELKSEIHTLVDELNALSMRNDELMSERERDAEGMDEMDAKVKEYKQKYDAVRIELRNLKATSTMFISKPVTDDHLPASADGNIADVNVSSFQTAIDGLLSAARSSTPTGVLPAMKAIVESVTTIGEDVKSFELHPNLDVDVSRLESLKHESTTRLNALMQAARNHAMASGLSPVSLLDAAAGHLSANVVEIIKLLKIRRGVRRQRSSLSIRDMVARSGSISAASPSIGAGANGSASPGGAGMSRTASNLSMTSTPALATASQGSRKVSVDQRPDRPIPRPLDTDRLERVGTGMGTPIDLAPLSARSGSALHSSSVRFDPSNASAPMFSGSSLPSSAVTSSGLAQSPSPNLSAQPPHSNTAGPPFRINSFLSERSDSFDLERKASMSSDRAGGPVRAVVESRIPNVSQMGQSESRSGSGSGYGQRQDSYDHRQGQGQVGGPEDSFEDDVPDDGGKEWEDLKPYLNAQSSALVNSIQNLLAAIRTNAPPQALNEHLSEVIAIASSIVAVSTNALPRELRPQGDGLLRDLVKDTNRLSEAQSGNTGHGGTVDKATRQQIASASFGVAKSLKALMKLGAE